MWATDPGLAEGLAASSTHTEASCDALVFFWTHTPTKLPLDVSWAGSPLWIFFTRFLGRTLHLALATICKGKGHCVPLCTLIAWAACCVAIRRLHAVIQAQQVSK